MILRRTIVATLAAIAMAMTAPYEASAGGYAAMEEIPVSGGELRLTKPVVATDTSGVTQELIQFPLTAMNISIDVSGPMAEYTVEQHFENPLDEPAEVVYVFPLGDDAAVSSYSIQIGDRVIAGKIKKREEARRIYEEAKTSGYTAGLLEQQKANVFSQEVANIPGKAKVVVKFRYVEMVDLEDGQYELLFPMVVGPRFLGHNPGRNPISSHSANGAGSVRSIGYLKSYGGPKVKITAKIDAGTPIKTMTSPSHSILQKSLDDTTIEASLDASKRAANRDFVLRYRPVGAQTTMSVLTHRNGNDGFFLLSVVPKQTYKTGDINPREVIFLIDQSGSMDGSPMAAARTLAKAMLETLSPKDTFNIVAFANGTEKFREVPASGNAAGKAAGAQWLDALTAGGGTDMEAGVLRSLATKPGEDRVRMVYIITDGYVGNDSVILSTAQKHLSHNRIFPVGVGSAPNRYLLDRMGELGRGFTRYIAPADNPVVVASELVKKSAYPYMTNLSIDWNGLPIGEVTPKLLPDVYAGRPVVIAGRYSKQATAQVVLRGTVAGNPVEIPLQIELPQEHKQRSVAYLWARRRIHELLAKDFGIVDSATQKSVTELGLNFGLVTDFTSYVAVDTRRVVSENGTAKTLVQPAPVPSGMTLWDDSTSVRDNDSGAVAQRSQRAPSASRARGDSGSRGHSVGGGDIDPLTLLMVFFLIPGALVLRRRRHS